MARAEVIKGDYIAAEKFYRKLIAEILGIGMHKSMQHANSLKELSLVLQRRGFYPEAETAIVNADRIASELISNDKLAVFKNELGVINEILGRYDEAEVFLNQSLQMYDRSWDSLPAYWQTVANLATVAERKGNFQFAEKSYRDVIDFCDQRFSPMNEASALAYGNLGLLYRKIGKNEDARDCFERALYVHIQGSGDLTKSAITPLTNFATLLIDQRQFDQGEALLDQAAGITDENYFREHLTNALIISLRARLAAMKGDMHGAIEHELLALSITEKVVGTMHLYTANRMVTLAGYYNRTEQEAKAEPLLRRALSVYDSSFTPTHPESIFARNYLAHSLMTMGKTSEAETMILESIRHSYKLFGRHHSQFAQALIRLGGLWILKDRPKIAERVCWHVLGIQSDLKLSADISLSNTLCNLAVVLFERREVDEALIWANTAVSSFEAILGAEHPELINPLETKLHIIEAKDHASLEITVLRARILKLKTEFGKL